MSKNALKDTAHSPIRDLVGFGLLAVSVFSLLSIISYSHFDPSLNTKVSDPALVIHNYCGIFGSYFADILIQLFGYASYLFPLALFGVTWAVVFRPTWRGVSVRVTGFVLFLLSVSLAFEIVSGSKPRMPAWGGLAGYVLLVVSKKYIGLAGAVVADLTMLLVALVLSVKLTFSGFVEWAKGLVGILGRIKTALTPFFEKAHARADAALAKEEKALEKSLKAIKTGDDPELPLAGNIRIGGDASEPEIDERKSRGADVIPINLPKPKKSLAPELPKFHTLDEESPDEKAARRKDKRPYKLPDITLLESREQELKINRDELFENAHVLEQKLKDFGVFGKVVGVEPGPVVTMYEYEPAPGVKVNQISRLNDDLALALKALSVRVTIIPGKAVIGIEVANRERQIVFLKDVVANDVFAQSASYLTLALGKDISGTPVVADLRRMPHLLMAGATGSGKSVSVNSAILSILYKSTPDEVRMILVDPKMLELSLYENIPHLLLPVVTDPRKAAAALRWAVLEMERRYRLMADLGVRNVEGYNKKVFEFLKDGKKKEAEVTPEGELPLGAENGGAQKKPEEHTGPIPFIMIVIDELADLMMVSSHEVEDSIIRLAQMARASGIHLLLATQRPSVDVITGVIKANMPARISFQVSSKIDSRTILDANGAELLLGAGDMLFLPPGTSKLQRIHGAFVTDNEVKRVTDFWKAQAQPEYDLDILKIQEEQERAEESENSGEDEEMYQQALDVVRVQRVASISLIQRKLRIGYNRAARIVERMEEDGLLAPGEVGKPREVNWGRLES